MKGVDFKILVKSHFKDEDEAAIVLEITKQHIFRLYKEEIVKARYVNRINSYINGGNAHSGNKSDDSNKLFKSNMEIELLQNTLQDKNDLIELLREKIEMLEEKLKQQKVKV